jgi:hypothetical protein
MQKWWIPIISLPNWVCISRYLKCRDIAVGSELRMGWTDIQARGNGCRVEEQGKQNSTYNGRKSASKSADCKRYEQEQEQELEALG